MTPFNKNDAKSVVSAFFNSSFTTYLHLDFLSKFILKIGGEDNFLKNIDNFIANGVNTQTLGDKWLENSALLFESHKDICLDSAYYWEFDGDNLMTFQTLNTTKSVRMMTKRVNQRHKALTTDVYSSFSENEVRDLLDNPSKCTKDNLLNTLIAEYCVGCAVELSCWSFKSFLRELI